MAKKQPGFGSPKVTWGWIPVALLLAIIMTALFALANSGK